MIFGVGHAFCILSVIGFDHWLYENSPDGRLLNATTKINMSITGQKTSPLCSPSTPNKDAWPRFLVIEAADDDHRPLTERMDVFALHKAIEGMSGPYESVKPMNNGKQLLVHFENKTYSDLLLYQTKNLIELPVKVTPHRTLNSSRCVISCRELANMTEEDIQEELQEQGVTKVERIKRRRDGQLMPTDSYILTINSQNIPSEIKVGFLIRKTKVYIPNPQRCFNCQKYGHNKKFYKNQQRCAKCAQVGHADYECDNEVKCANCEGDHPAYMRICPRWKIEQKILKEKFENNISFHEARKRIEGPLSDPTKNSYANVSKPHQWTNNIKNPNNFKSEEEWLAHTIQSLLERLDAIRAQKSNQNGMPSTSSASQLDEIALPISASEQKHESEKLNSASALPSTVPRNTIVVSNEENDMEITSASAKRPINDDSSEEEQASSFPAKKAATSSASEQSGTRVPKGRGGGDLTKISAFPAKAPKSGGRGSSQGDKSPTRPPRFSNTGEGSTISAQGGRNRAAINRQSLSKPPGTATKDKTKSKEKNTHS